MKLRIIIICLFFYIFNISSTNYVVNDEDFVNRIYCNIKYIEPEDFLFDNSFLEDSEEINLENDNLFLDFYKPDLLVIFNSLFVILSEPFLIYYTHFNPFINGPPPLFKNTLFPECINV